jgi:glycosyltransferase involved in cell wall biosynthesis
MLVHPPDVLFVPAHTLPMILPRRSVTTLHDLGFLSVPDAYSWGERLYHRLSARSAVRRATRLITVSEFSRSELVRLLGVARERVTVTPLACDRLSFRPDLPTSDMAAAVARYGVRRPYFLFVGRLERKKNLDVLLRAFGEYVRGGGAEGRRGGDAELVLVGKRGLGAEEVFAGLDERTRERVFELGYVAAADLPLLYAGATAFVFPSRFEGFGIPLLEAFSSGVPVIASNITSIPEVADGAAVLVSPDDVGGLAVAMRRVETDAIERESLIKAGLARADAYSWQKTAEATWDVLRSVLD